MGIKKQIILLQVIKAGQTQTHEIHKSEFILGRGDTSEIPINENAISREHLKIIVDDNIIKIQDLKSSNGTFVEGERIDPRIFTSVLENQLVTFGNAQTKIKLKIVEVAPQILQQASELEKVSQEMPVVADISAFPKSTDDFRNDFKNIGLSAPQIKTPSQQAKEIIEGAEYIKRSIIKSAEVYKTKMINETICKLRKLRMKLISCASKALIIC